LGGVSVDRKGLTLECISKERLERGKQRLNNLLKDHIDHKIDTFENMEATIDRDGRERHDEEEEFDSRAQFVMESMLQQKFRNWVNERIPALEGMTPHEAARSVDRREKVLEMIKDMENREERKKMKGMHYMDIGFIREELGLRSEEA